MKSIKNILQNIFTLATGIILLGYKIIRQVILPSGGNKGNLLSSLFTFIVGILEGLIQFERNLLKAPMLFRNKYIRQGLQITAAIFLFIGSLEWSASAAPASRPETLQSAQNITQAPVQESTERRPFGIQTQVYSLPFIASTVTPYSSNTTTNTKKYLLICCFRI
jgi:hypothetical protein